MNEHRCQGSHRDHLDQLIEDEQKENQKYCVIEIDPGGSATGDDIGGTFYDTGNNRQTADHRRTYIGDAHGEKSTVRIRFAFIRIDLVDSMDGGKGLGTVHDGERKDSDDNRRQKSRVTEECDKVGHDQTMLQRITGDIHQKPMVQSQQLTQADTGENHCQVSRHPFDPLESGFG